MRSMDMYWTFFFLYVDVISFVAIYELISFLFLCLEVAICLGIVVCKFVAARSSYTCFWTHLLFFEHLRVFLLADSTILLHVVSCIAATILVPTIWVLPAIFPRYFWKCKFLLLVINLIDWTFLLHNFIIEWSLVLNLLFFFLLDIFFRIINDEKFLLGFHFAADEAAVESSIPFLLIFLWLKLHVDVKPLLIFLDGKHYKNVRLSVVVHILDFMQFDWFIALSLLNWVIQSELIWFQKNQTFVEFVDHDIQICFWDLVFKNSSGQYLTKILDYCVLIDVLQNLLLLLCDWAFGIDLLYFSFVDHFENSVVLLQVDVKLYFWGFVATFSSSYWFFVGIELLQNLEGRLYDSFDGSVFVDFFG